VFGKQKLKLFRKSTTELLLGTADVVSNNMAHLTPEYHCLEATSTGKAKHFPYDSNVHRHNDIEQPFRSKIQILFLTKVSWLTESASTKICNFTSLKAKT